MLGQLLQSSSGPAATIQGVQLEDLALLNQVSCILKKKYIKMNSLKSTNHQYLILLALPQAN